MKRGKILVVNDKEERFADASFIRALDLFDLTIKYGRQGRNDRGQMLEELCRA